MSRKNTLCALALALALLAGCAGNTHDDPAAGNTPAASGGQTTYENEVAVVLSDTGVTVNGEAAAEDQGSAVYLAHDIVYYEDRDSYDSGYPYGEGDAGDRHSAEEAAAHTVIHITQPGFYRISGTLSQGQIAVDLGEEAKRDPGAVVTLILDGADITCTVAPAVIFYNVYECDTAWVAYDEGEAETYTANPVQDTSAAGANVIVADSSVNHVTGSYVARIYKDKEGEKKLHKYDAAFYSKQTMNVTGESVGSGELSIYAENEGLDSELHLTINGGRINIQAGNDGINTNEDNVSVTTINGGALHIVAGLGDEGDGIDSNGYLVINGGVVISAANPAADAGLDSDLGSYINGGWVLAVGSTMDWAESDSAQVTMNLQFAASQGADEAIVVTDTEGAVVFAYDPDQDEATGTNNRSYMGAILSCPEFRVGETYYVYVGGSVTGTEENGLYDTATVTGFDGAARQQYTGTDVGMMFGGGFMGGQRPGGQEPPQDWDRGELPDGIEPPEGWDGGNWPEGEQPPEGWDGGNWPEGEQPPEGWDTDRRPEGETPPEDMIPGGMGRPGEEEQTASVNFFLSDQVNSFSGITDQSEP